MGKYKKCPRCELNWILDNEEYCEVCKAELGKASRIVLLDEDDDDADEKLCPICKINYIGADEDMCPTCRAAHAGDSWDNYEPDTDENAELEEDETLIEEEEDVPEGFFETDEFGSSEGLEPEEEEEAPIEEEEEFNDDELDDEEIEEDEPEEEDDSDNDNFDI